jgi:superfamily II DNA/RNA helicase
MQTIGEQLEATEGLSRMVLPDLWQQNAVAALRAGQDVVLQAPTGAGKTLVFELWSNNGHPKGQAIYTVPTRALANDKLAEWRAKGWNVGIATGDLSENLSAPILVATLETQKNRLIRGTGPTLLVIDEYQMLADPARGLNYELAIALAPPETRLLLMSGSVGNPRQVANWLRRLGRDAVVVEHHERPVPLEEVHANSLSFRVPGAIRGYWPRLVARALAEGLGPILVFAPRRRAAESLAAELARTLPTPDPLALTPRQKKLVGESLARMLRSRIAFHHSGLSYAARAGVIEPLAKAGQLRVVVATMGLAAGINFSLRTVALAGDSYRRDDREQMLRADEILQMFGRAGRRGIDETGYALVTRNEIRLVDAHTQHLARNGMVDWPALLGLMQAAAEEGRNPYVTAIRAQARLFTTKPIHLGVEHALQDPGRPCGLLTDAERARRVRHRIRQMYNSRGEWEPLPRASEVLVNEVFLHERKAEQSDEETDAEQAGPRLRPALSVPEALAKVGTGSLCRVDPENGEPRYGRVLTVAERVKDEQVLLAKWVRRLTQWHGRKTHLAAWRKHLVPRVEKGLAQRGTPVLRFQEHERKITATVNLAGLRMRAFVDRHGVALWNPPTRQVQPESCRQCAAADTCRSLSRASGTALLWRRLRLVDEGGAPTRRGRVVSFFAGGDGLAIVAALEDRRYPLDELVYDVACLRAGFRFAEDGDQWAGRLAIACHQAYGTRTLPGYLENGLPPEYGAGAEVIVASVHQNPKRRQEWIRPQLGVGDIDRLIIEWRSLLRQVTHAPTLAWDRWTDFQNLAQQILKETESPTLTDLPPLEHHQRQRMEHTLILRRH